MTIFCVTRFNYHDLTILLIPLYGLMRVLLDKRLMSIETAAVLPLGWTMLFFISSLFIPALKDLVLYPPMLLIALALWWPEKLIFRMSQT